MLFDAATCAVMGLALVLAASPLAALTLIPVAILFYAGVALLPIAAFMGAVAFGRVRSIAGPVLVIGGNVLWVIASVALMAGDWIAPNGLGCALIGAQAVAVAILAGLELSTLRRGSVRALGMRRRPPYRLTAGVLFRFRRKAARSRRALTIERAPLCPRPRK